ncbi:MAG: L-histidine N(alpha)-methyltransferase [Reichenbachiella sp.]
MIEQFKQTVDEGLRKTPKQLPSKYFYDKKGDALFVKIMQMPEYYLTRAEHEIFRDKTNDLIESLGLCSSEHKELIELGAGDGTKTFELLNALREVEYPFEYCPVDISKNALNLLESAVNKQCPGLKVTPLQGDYFEVLEKLKDSDHKKVVLFLGSNIGNLHDDQASQFLKLLRDTLNVGDKLLLGVDLLKSKDIVLPAYNDKEGITREFNLNLLHRINRELDADFEVESFEHRPEYDEEIGIAESYLESLQEQTVRINGTGVYTFKKGERIHTEISRKYNDAILARILEGTGFTITAKLMDQNELFADYILEVS